MSLAFIASMMPWLIFFIFAAPASIQTASLISIVAIIVFNYQRLVQKKYWDWLSFIFLILFFYLLYRYQTAWIADYGYLIANLYLATILFISVKWDKPLFMQYAQDIVPQEEWQDPIFIDTQRINTIFWSGLFLVNAIFSTLVLLLHGEQTFIFDWFLPIILIMLGMAFSHSFPKWYRHRRYRQLGIDNLKGISDIQILRNKKSLTAYRSIGQGEPLIMLMGTHMTMHCWEPRLIEALSQHYRVIILDYPGIGASRDKREFTFDNLCHYVSEFCQNLKLDHINLCGYSFGGFLAQMVALNNPQLVKRLILISTDCGGDYVQPGDPQYLMPMVYFHDMSSEDELKKLSQILFPSPVPPQLRQRIRQIYTAASFEARLSAKRISKEYQAYQYWYDNEGTYDKLANLKCASLIISGKQDNIIPPENGHALHSQLNNSQLVEFDNVAHGIIYQLPLKLADTIREFIENDNVNHTPQ